MAANQIISGVAGRYANALFDLAAEEKAVPATAKGLQAFQSLIEESVDLQRLLNSPVFKAEDQMDAVTALASKSGVNGLALNFIKLMCDKRRLAALPDAIRGFQALVAESKGESVAEVTSAEKLTAGQISDLKAALKAKLGKDVQLSTQVDSSILGGLIVKVGTTMIDNSLKTKLSNLKTAMKGTG
ncbi:MAG: F0F1 ATP synthase subunit delta [Alphaproteobacteria bacterium]|nr:F0F1 ATP synthase subunit delta [Alphaproteobacteria bacterium]